MTVPEIPTCPQGWTWNSGGCYCEETASNPCPPGEHRWDELSPCTGPTPPVERCRDGFISDPGECGCIPDCDPGEQWCERSNSCIEDPGEPPCAGLNAFWDYDSCQWLYVDPCFPGKMNLDTCECEYCPTNYTYCGAICWPYVLPPCWAERNCVWNYDTCTFDCDTVVCPNGEIYDLDLCLCRPRCPDGQDWCESTQECVDAVPGPGVCWQLPYVFNKTTCEVEVSDPCPCPTNYHWDNTICRCVPDTWTEYIDPGDIGWVWFEFPLEYEWWWSGAVGPSGENLECPDASEISEYLLPLYNQSTGGNLTGISNEYELIGSYVVDSGYSKICRYRINSECFGMSMSASEDCLIYPVEPCAGLWSKMIQTTMVCRPYVDFESCVYQKPFAHEVYFRNRLSPDDGSVLYQEAMVRVLLPYVQDNPITGSRETGGSLDSCDWEFPNSLNPAWPPDCGTRRWVGNYGWCDCSEAFEGDDDPEDKDAISGPWIARINNGFAAVSALSSGSVVFLVGDAHGPPWTTYTVAEPTDEEVLGRPRHALSTDHSVMLVYSYRVGAVSEIRMQTSQDEGETWTEAETMISNAQSPTIQVDFTTGMSIIAGTRNGIVVAKRKFSGESDWSDEFNFELSDGTPLAIDGSFHLVFGNGVDNEWLLVGRAPNATSVSTWRSFDEAETWELVS